MSIRKLTAAAGTVALTAIVLAGCGSTTTLIEKPAAASSAAATTAPAAAPTTTTAPAPPTRAAPTSAPPSQPVLTNPVAVVTQFYQDISDGDYSAAWALGGSNLTGGATYAQWAAGYRDTTASISVLTASNWNSDTAYAEISAVQLDGSTKTYAGTYTVHGGVITSANIRQTS